MRAIPKKIRRRRSAGELAVEQLRESSPAAAMLQRAGFPPERLGNRDACFLMAWFGDDPAGVAVLETNVDAALMRMLFVEAAHRRGGAGSALLAALRTAAHTRGATALYAMVPDGAREFFTRIGFVEMTIDETGRALEGFAGEAGATHRCVGLRLDISRDGIVER